MNCYSGNLNETDRDNNTKFRKTFHSIIKRTSTENSDFEKKLSCLYK